MGWEARPLVQTSEREIASQESQELSAALKVLNQFNDHLRYFANGLSS